MSKFITYKCDTCDRTIEQELDPIRPFIDRCNITYRCEGHLKKIGEKNVKTELVPIPLPGMVSWRQRGADPILPITSSAPKDISVLTGPVHLTIGVDKSFTAYDGSPIILRLNVKSDSARPFAEYNYEAPSLSSVITGLDVSNKNLIIGNTIGSDIIVYVNGVRVYENQGSLGDYSVDYDFQAIRFNNQFTDTAHIKIIVYGAAVITNYDLSFSTINSLISAWGNIAEVSNSFETYTLKTCSDFSMIPINKYLTPIQATFNGTEIPLDKLSLFLAMRPWSYFDRVVIKRLSLSISDLQMYYTLMDDLEEIVVPSNQLTDIYPPLNEFTHLTTFDTIYDRRNQSFLLIRDKPTTDKIFGPAT